MARIDSRQHNKLISQFAPQENGKYVRMWLGYTDTEYSGYWLDSNRKYPGYTNWGSSFAGMPLPDNAARVVNGVRETQGKGIINMFLNFYLNQTCLV